MDVFVRLSRDEAHAVIEGLPAQLSGRQNDLADLVRDVLLAVGEEALAVISEAYHLKGLGGTDAAGIRWPPRKNPDRKPVLRTIWGRHVAPARQVQVDPRPIGIRTGRLVTSLEPGSASADQVLEVGPGSVTAGTRVPYANHFAEARPIFPEGEWPQEWLDRLAARLARRLPELIEAAFRRAGGG